MDLIDNNNESDQLMCTSEETKRQQNNNDNDNNSIKNSEQQSNSLIANNVFPYNLDGTISKDGNMTNFIAENLEYQIKISSSTNKKDYQSIPSTSGFVMVKQLPLKIDSNVLNDIEIEAQYLASSVDNLTENLCNLLHSISSMTADNVELHKNSLHRLTDCMDGNIKSMYTIMAKTEELTKLMKPTEQLSQRIREIKKLVDMLESHL